MVCQRVILFVMTDWISLLFLLFFTPSNAIITYYLYEEQPLNTMVGSLALDAELPGSGHLYKLEVGAPYLRVDETTGDLLTTEVPIDRETLRDCENVFENNPCFMEFEVSVIDLMKGSVPRLIEGRIEIQDENDNTPQFSSPVLSLSIPENTHVGALFAIPVATDKDAGSNGIADYSLTSLDATEVFGLQMAGNAEEKVPQLMVLDSLDREQRDFYDLTIKVMDGGHPPRHSTALLRITITDTNDNVPKFEHSHYECELEENTPRGTTVLQVKANDADLGENGEVTFSFYQPTKTIQHLLGIETKTGAIYVKNPADREKQSFLNFSVQAKDNGLQAMSSRAQVAIKLKDENDNSPLIMIRGFAMVAHKDGIANISEDMPVGTVVAVVEVTDRDEGMNAMVTCVVAGDVPFRLQSASDTGKKKYFLLTTTPLDFEHVKEYTIEITAVDSGNPALSSTNQLKVQVTDVNDNAPIFSSSKYEVDFLEENQPGDKILDIVATDADSGTNAELTYKIIQDSDFEGLFKISPNTGEVQVTKPLDREHKERYEFLVEAMDKGNPSMMETVTVVINVLDLNDNDPKFMLSSYTFSVLENRPPLSAVGMVTVTDVDQGENGQVHLSVEPDDGKFFIQNGTFTILSSSSFDREKEKTYTFKLKAVDGGDPPRSTYVGISINVLDENDNAPYVDKPSNSSYKFLSPLTRPKSHVETVEAKDNDTGLNADLDFSFVGGNPHELFYISSTGEITLSKELSRQHNGLHRLVIKVSDKGKPSKHTTALVHIFINETIGNVTLVESLIDNSIYTPIDKDIAGFPDYAHGQQSSIIYAIIAGIAGVILVILVVVVTRYHLQKRTKTGYQPGKKEDFYTHKQAKIEDEDERYQKGIKLHLMSDRDTPKIHQPLNYAPDSPDLGRHYYCHSPLPSIEVQPQSPTASKKHQAVQDLPATNTFVGTEDNSLSGSDQYSDYSYKSQSHKYTGIQVGDHFQNMTTGYDFNIFPKGMY